MPFSAISRQDGGQRILRTRCQVDGIVEDFPVYKVSSMSFQVGVMPNNNGTDVHQNNFAPGQPSTSDTATMEFLVITDKFKAVQDWVKLCHDGKDNVSRKTLVYKVLKPQVNESVMEITWHDCYPIAMEILGSDVDNGQDVMRASLTVKVLRMTLG
jgi:hypothetical protein